MKNKFPFFLFNNFSYTPGGSALQIILLAVIITMTSFYYILRAGGELGKKIGVTGMRVIQRIMGLILMGIAIQFVINGVETILLRI